VLRRLLDAEAQAERWQTTAASWRERYYAEAGTRWDDELPPGGEVCATCEQPVESEPCRDHNPRVLAERLRAERDAYADRVDTLTSVAKGNKRHVQEMYAELAAPRELFLAEYEGDEPRLYLTLDAARDALTTARNTGDPLVPWAWQEQDGVWAQWRTSPEDDDRPVELLLGSVMRVVLPAGLLAGAAEQQATAGPYVWQVWEEDGPLYGVYASRADAEQGTIDCYRDMGESCPDYSWRWTSTGTQGELLAGDEPVGIWLARHQVRGTATPAGPREGDRAHIARHDFVCFAEDIEGGGSR
jgi:hypothetical protein